MRGRRERSRPHRRVLFSLGLSSTVLDRLPTETDQKEGKIRCVVNSNRPTKKGKSNKTLFDAVACGGGNHLYHHRRHHHHISSSRPYYGVGRYHTRQWRERRRKTKWDRRESEKDPDHGNVLHKLIGTSFPLSQILTPGYKAEVFIPPHFVCCLYGLHYLSIYAEHGGRAYRRRGKTGQKEINGSLLDKSIYLVSRTM